MDNNHSRISKDDLQIRVWKRKGYMDMRQRGGTWPKEYDSWGYTEQMNYENGRQMACAYALAMGCRVSGIPKWEHPRSYPVMPLKARLVYSNDWFVHRTLKKPDDPELVMAKPRFDRRGLPLPVEVAEAPKALQEGVDWI